MTERLYQIREPEIKKCQGCADEQGIEKHLCPLLAKLDRENYRDHPCNCCKMCEDRCLRQT